MALDFTKIGDVELLESVPSTANAVVEVDGAFKRVPGGSLGGGKTALIHLDMGDAAQASLANLSAGVSTLEARDSNPVYTATCENMTFEEAVAILSAQQPLSVMIDTTVMGMYACGPAISAVYLVQAGITCIMIAATYIGSLYWTADGISTEEPREPK